MQPARATASATTVALLGLAYQGVYAVGQMVALGLVARRFSVAEYGLWLTVLAVTNWIPVLAIGQNAVVLSGVGAAAGVDADVARRRFLASLGIVGAVVGLALALLLVLGPWFPWAALLNAQAPALAALATPVAVAACAAALLALPLIQVGYSVYANHRGDLTHGAMIAGSLASLALTALAVRQQAPLWVVGAVSLGGPLIGGAALLLRPNRDGLLPWAGPWGWRTLPLASAWSAGVQFLLVDGLSLLVVRTPDFIVAQLHGVEAVSSFASVGRLTALSLAVYQALAFPVWPALAQAQAQGRTDEVRRLARRCALQLAAVALAIALGIVVAGGWFVGLWLGRPDLAPPALLWAAGAQALGLAALAWLTVMLSALSQRRLLLLALGAIVATYAVLALALGMALGPVGVAWGQALATLGLTAGFGLRAAGRVFGPATRPAEAS